MPDRVDGMCQCVREGLAEPWHHSPTCPHTRTPAKAPVHHLTFTSSVGSRLRDFPILLASAVVAMYLADVLFGRWW